MTKNVERKNIEQLLAEADVLIQQINTDDITNMDEEYQLLFERHSQDYNNLKSRVYTKSGNTETPELASSAEGIHEAIQDIVKAMQDLKNRFF